MAIMNGCIVVFFFSPVFIFSSWVIAGRRDCSFPFGSSEVSISCCAKSEFLSPSLPPKHTEVFQSATCFLFYAQINYPAYLTPDFSLVKMV